jgi:hypothetical protein
MQRQAERAEYRPQRDQAEALDRRVRQQLARIAVLQAAHVIERRVIDIELDDASAQRIGEFGVS